MDLCNLQVVLQHTSTPAAPFILNLMFVVSAVPRGSLAAPRPTFAFPHQSCIAKIITRDGMIFALQLRTIAILRSISCSAHSGGM